MDVQQLRVDYLHKYGMQANVFDSHIHSADKELINQLMIAKTFDSPRHLKMLYKIVHIFQLINKELSYSLFMLS